MLACGCFQVPIFIYHDWKDHRGKLHNIPPEVEVSSDGFTTKIFIPQGNGGALAIRRPGITLPFQMKSVCIQLKTFHFQWLKVRPTNNTWSKCKEEEKVCFTYFLNTTTILAKWLSGYSRLQVAAEAKENEGDKAEEEAATEEKEKVSYMFYSFPMNKEFG